MVKNFDEAREIVYRTVNTDSSLASSLDREGWKTADVYVVFGDRQQEMGVRPRIVDIETGAVTTVLPWASKALQIIEDDGYLVVTATENLEE